MERQKRWQLFLILAVVALTIYNILPTLFYYSNPLKKPIGQTEAMGVAQGIVSRVNKLESFTIDWLKAESKNLGLKPKSITLDSHDPKLAHVSFKKPGEASLFAKTLQRAGALIPFVPAQLSPDPRSFESGTTTVTVQRRIGVHLDPAALDQYFTYIPKTDEQGNVSKPYRQLTYERAAEVAVGFGGVSEPASMLLNIDKVSEEALIRLARSIVDYENAFGDESPITKRYFASFTQIAPGQKDKEQLVHRFTAKMEHASQKLTTAINAIQEKKGKLKEEGGFLDSADQQKIEVFENQKNILNSATLIVRRNAQAFQNGLTPLTHESVEKTLASKVVPKEKAQFIDIGQRNPFVDKIAIDWNKEALELLLHPEVTKLRSGEAKSEAEALQQEKLNQLLFNVIAQVARASEETITPSLADFTIQLNALTNSSSLLALNLGAIAEQQLQTLKHLVQNAWTPEEGELAPDAYPIYTHEEFAKLPPAEQKLGLVIYAPSIAKKTEPGFRSGSIYVIARGLGSIMNKYRELPESKEKSAFDRDFRALSDLLRQNGFIAYQGSGGGLPEAYKNDFIFELDDYASYLIAATREDFSLKGIKHYALLEFTNVEQRILALNKIQTREHEDLVKWRDEYQSAKVALRPGAKYDVPPPTKSVFWNNMKLSFIKYFRGDERKILKWGLDLSGGKTVRIGLKDQNGSTISNEDDLREAVNELYQRVNRLGVSEVGIRTEGSTIVLDFPGSQELSASDLIQASAMYFHIVNEKFTPNNPTLSEAVGTFLEEVWNEAVITNRTDSASINEIAWQHLGGSSESEGEFHPLSSHARLLYDNGLRLAGPKAPPRSGAFNDTLSSVGIFRGKDYSDWYGQTNPLVFVFRNYALEGSNLSDVQTGYDTAEGNLLHFSVKGSYTTRDGQRVSPRDEFYAWTSQFAEERIAGTPKEAFSQGRGWRMAVVLNGTIISAPTLNAALRDNARISGHFSQREVNQLAADLKAGSLSFTPHILSEENISPDLGKEQRNRGILASLIGLMLVIAIMCSYYRFGGVIASIAVLFNLLITWGVLQNLGAAITLPGLAGIILAVGMAVDANVLIFERIREEFAISGRLPSAVQAGYRKAFSAIVDSNLTTIIAGIILFNFDSGPIKGFALTLIIGIVSSMFTALFMTRYFFSGWVQNPKHKELKMARLFGQTKINFLGKAKYAFVLTAIVVVIGTFFLIKERNTIFGMDFTGGYALTLDLQEDPGENYRARAEKALEAAGASSNDFQIRGLTKPNQLRLQLGVGMEQEGRPFYHIDAKEAPEKTLFSYQQYPRIVWIVDALEQGGLQLNPASLPNLSLYWTEMSGQLSDTMRNQALLGLGLALICILIYITFRFEFKYAISATLALAHDLLITLGLLAICHLFWEGIQIDLQVIAALMTIVGYSLNDTIIIFDRIREDIKQQRKMSFPDILNHALNATLSRTVMTTGTTLAVLLALVFIGGGTILNFALIMTLGVGVGTLSSLFVAAPLLRFFHMREEAKSAETPAHG